MQRLSPDQVLQDPLKLLQRVLDASLNGIILLQPVRDEAGRTLDLELVLFNRAAEHILRRTGGPLEGGRLRELFPGEPSAAYHEFIKVLEGGPPFIGENHLRKHGFDHHFEVTAAPYEGGLLVTFNDISARKRAEEQLRLLNAELTERVQARTAELERSQQELRQSAERFRSLFEAIPNLAWTGLSDGTITYGNRAWKSFYGVDDASILEWDWKLGVHPDDHERIRCEGIPAVLGRQIYEAEYRRIRHDGEVRWMLTRATPVMNRQGEIALWVCTATDIHEQKRHQEELEAANRLLNRINADLDNFIYTASHDLRAPIANIEGLVALLQQMLTEGPPDSPEADHIMAMITESIGRFRTTIQELSDVATSVRDITEDVHQQTIDAIVDDIRLSLEKEIRATGARLTVQTRACPHVRFSRKNLRSVLYNLISNGIKYHAPDRPPHIRVRTDLEPDGSVLLEVSDNGLGIPADQQTAIFSLSTRVHHHVEGTGMGLYIVRRIVENAGGRITLDSREGEGTTFRVVLPG